MRLYTQEPLEPSFSSWFGETEISGNYSNREGKTQRLRSPAQPLCVSLEQLALARKSAQLTQKAEWIPFKESIIKQQEG